MTLQIHNNARLRPLLVLLQGAVKNALLSEVGEIHSPHTLLIRATPDVLVHMAPELFVRELQSISHYMFIFPTK
jgi:hypothetical protein